MPETRSLDQPEEAVARLERELEDLRSTVLARSTRLPVGTMHATMATVPPPHTLIMTGQTVSRAEHPHLWQWVQDRAAGGFGPGDGSTTFTLPDMRGRALIGAGTLGADTYTVGQGVGAARVGLSTAQLPSHSHSGSGSSGSTSHSHSGSSGSSSHSHSASTGTAGAHGGHVTSSVTRTSGGDLAAHPTTSSAGGHSHSVSVGSDSHSHSVSVGSDSHSHSVSVSVGTTGSGDVHENRPPSRAVNWLIWT